MSSTKLVLLEQIVEGWQIGKPEWASPKHLLRGGNFESVCRIGGTLEIYGQGYK